MRKSLSDKTQRRNESKGRLDRPRHEPMHILCVGAMSSRFDCLQWSGDRADLLGPERW